MVGGCLVGSYSRGLSRICLSSGEAEFNGGVVATSEGIFYKEIFAFFRVRLQLRMCWTAAQQEEYTNERAWEK